MQRLSCNFVICCDANVQPGRQHGLSAATGRTVHIAQHAVVALLARNNIELAHASRAADNDTAEPTRQSLNQRSVPHCWRRVSLDGTPVILAQSGGDRIQAPSHDRMLHAAAAQAQRSLSSPAALRTAFANTLQAARHLPRSSIRFCAAMAGEAEAPLLRWGSAFGLAEPSRVLFVETMSSARVEAISGVQPGCFPPLLPPPPLPAPPLPPLEFSPHAHLSLLPCWCCAGWASSALAPTPRHGTSPTFR